MFQSIIWIMLFVGCHLKMSLNAFSEVSPYCIDAVKAASISDNVDIRPLYKT